MIDELHVRDVALIREATLYPAHGLTVVTGETGAGKTALLFALKLLSGERADASMVRDGASSLQVTGRFFFGRPDNGLKASCSDAEPQAASGEGVVADRVLTVDGRSRVHVDGAMAGVARLAATIGSTIDLCGQHEHQRLLKSSNHRAMLDAWMGDAVAAVFGEYAQAYQNAQAAAKAVEAVRTAGLLDGDRIEQSRFVLRRIDEVSPSEDEYDELRALVPKLENAEALTQAVSGAHAALADDGGALDAVGRAAALLESAASVDPALGEAAGSLREASYIVEDVVRDVRGYCDGIEYDGVKLEELQERMGDLQGLMRTWGPTMAEVLQARDNAKETVTAVEGFEERLASARKTQDEAEKRLAQAASSLHAARVNAAPGFDRAVNAQMDRLELGGAGLECSVENLPREKWTSNGSDRVEFMFRPGIGLGARPLGKIASGGEASRVMLAIKVVLGDADDVETLVFDEVDAGVGGSAARALADVLVDLARTHQVIVVTHLAQVAVMGDVQYVVSKSSGEKPETALQPVLEEDRVAEIARMLSGDTGDASLAHARQMLDEAAR
jgi:DNA repair protein RecN (Recombination protein N)